MNHVTEYTFDAAGKKLGRLASEVAGILQGKNLPSYKVKTGTPSGPRVVVKNASKIALSGKKETQKVYHRHTGYMGHLKQETPALMRAKYPERMVWYAVYNMLPKNR